MRCPANSRFFFLNDIAFSLFSPKTIDLAVKKNKIALLPSNQS